MSMTHSKSNGQGSGHDIIVVGASAGGVAALMELCRALPKDLRAAILVVIHTSPTSTGILPQVIGRAGPLPAQFPEQGETIKPGTIYIAPPNHHMLISDGVISLTYGPKENGFRPAVDPMFRTAARAFGTRVIGVILSGGLDDGSEGLLFIKKYGGLAVVQDPREADFPSMPASALEAVDVDHVVKVREMAELLPKLVRLAAPPASQGVPMASPQDRGPGPAEAGDQALTQKTMPGSPPLTCPECGGSLWEFYEGRKLSRYRCHVGHNFTPKGLLANKTSEVEGALWTALRALEENAELRRRMCRRAQDSNLGALAQQYEQAAIEAENRARLIRVLLTEQQDDGEEELPAPRHGRRAAANRRRAS